MSEQIEMKQIVRKAQTVKVDAGDLITPLDAARLAKTTISTITRRMDAGELPTYVKPGAEGMRPQRYTSRRAVNEMNRRFSARLDL